MLARYRGAWETTLTFSGVKSSRSRYFRSLLKVVGSCASPSSLLPSALSLYLFIFLLLIFHFSFSVGTLAAQLLSQ